MTEVIADLDNRLIDDTGREYVVNVAGEQMGDGRWEGWLEFVPFDDGEPLLTNTETTQSTREDLAEWAETLGDVYIQGAFNRSAPVLGPRAAATPMVAGVASDVPAVIDPFA